MVNVSDFDVVLPEGDLLETIFSRQKELMDKYHSIEEANMGQPVPQAPLDLNDRHAQARIKDFAWRVTEEIGEACNCLKLKPWKSTPQLTDEVHFREELIDALHFFIELLILCGFDAESATKMYLNKHAVNKFRQSSNY